MANKFIEINGKKIDITLCKTIICEECGNFTFRPQMVFKEVSGLLIGKPDNIIAEVMIYVCSGCGKMKGNENLTEDLKKIST
jgi:DNA-directed RNA polymerase subunit RPC12/RpoP